MTSKGLGRKWFAFFLFSVALVVGAFATQRFLLAPAPVETKGEHGNVESETPP